MNYPYKILLIFFLVALGCSLFGDDDNNEKEKEYAFNFSQEKNFDFRPITGVYIDSKNREMVATWEGLTLNIDGVYFSYVSEEETQKVRKIIEFGGTYYASSNDGDIFLKSDNGINWEVFANPNGRTYDFIMLKSGRLLIGGINGVFYKDQGSDVITKREFFFAGQYTTNSIDHLIETSSGAVLAGTHDGIYRSLDKGETWNKVSNNISKHQDEISMFFKTESGIILAGHSDLFYRSSDNGNTWGAMTLPDSYPKKMIASGGIEYILLSEKIWARKEGTIPFIPLEIEKFLGETFNENGPFQIYDFYIKGNTIIVYKDIYPNGIFIGHKNSKADIWDDLEN